MDGRRSESSDGPTTVESYGVSGSLGVVSVVGAKI